jgi:hypothetical protein
VATLGGLGVRLGGVPSLAGVSLAQILQVLGRGPQSSGTLAQGLGYGSAQLESALAQLARGGYIEPAKPGEGACSSGCGWCSHKSFCPSGAPQAAQGDTWRLTAKGEAATQGGA